MRVELQLREDLVAVELGHQDVEQHQVEVLAAQQVERLAAVLLRRRRSCPCCSRPRLSRRLFTRLSSTTRIVPGGRGGGTHDAAVDWSASERLSRAAYSRSIRSTSSVGAVQLVAPRSQLELSAELGEASRPERLAVRLQRVRRPPQSLRVALLVGRPQSLRRGRARRSGTCRSPPRETLPAEVSQALDRARVEAGAGALLAHRAGVLRADGRGSAPPRARSDGSASRRSRPSRRRSRPRGPRAARSPSSR